MTEKDPRPEHDASTPESLAKRVQQGSKTAFSELVSRFGPRLFDYFYQRIGCREDCEDLVQETLVKAYRNIHRYEGHRTFSTWLYTIGTRQMVDYLRSRNRRRTERIPCDLPVESDPSEDATRRDERCLLWSRVRRLPKKQYDVLWLRYVEELPVKEIGRALGMTGMHVKVLLYRARARLAKDAGILGPAVHKTKGAASPAVCCRLDEV